ncbi:MAG: glycosyltransferase family 2 protein [Sedimentisphaerales bacterium]
MEKQLHSIIIPVYNSKEILETLVEKVSNIMREADLHFEIVFVDDGSHDNSFEEIKRLASIHSVIRGFRLSRNFGHQAALMVGLQESRGELVAIMDDDLQDPPELLPKLFQTVNDDVDIAYGVRKKRKEGILKRFLYFVFYRILKFLSHIDIPLDAGDFCAMKRCVVNVLLQLREANPFLRGIRAWIGFKQVGVEYERAVRHKGKSGYSLRGYINLAITGLIMFSYIPLRIATYLGIFAAGISFLYAIVIITYWIFIPFNVPGYLSLVAIITLLGGVQLISIGIIGEYIARLNDNVRKWPVAIVAETTQQIKVANEYTCIGR